MIYINSKIHACRFGNFLYYLLRMYIKSKENNELCKFHIHKYIKEFIFLNMIKYTNYDSDENIDLKNAIRENYYYQIINKDYNRCDIENFLKDTLFKSKKFQYAVNSFDESQDVCSVHIRCGDYITRGCNRKIYGIDRNKYILSSIDLMGDKEYHIFSDSIEYCKQNYDNLFKRKGVSVKYIQTGNFLDDFLTMSLYKNRILWNSTFSYWGGYITNVYYGDNNVKILVPDYYFCGFDNGKCVCCFDNWIQMESR